MAESLNRKLSYLYLQVVLAWVHAAAWVYSWIFRRRKPLVRVRRVAAVWWCPPDLPGSNLRLGNWKPFLEDCGVAYDNFSVSSLSELEEFDRAPWSWRYDYFRRLALDRFEQFKKLRGYDVVWIERAFLIYPSKSAFIETCIRRMVGMVVLDCTDGSDYTNHKDLALSLVDVADRVTTGCKSLCDFYETLHSDVAWINWAIPTDRYQVKGSYEIQGLPVLGWMGSPGNAKQLQRLEPQLRKLAEKMPFRLRIICRQKIEMDIPGADVEHAVFDDSYYDLLASFDVGLMPLLTEGFASTGKVAMKNQEFMLCAIPQVCSPRGICEAIIDGDSALIAPTEEDWAPVLTRLLTDENLRRRLGTRSREIFLDMYTYRGEFPKLLAALITPPRENPIRGRQRAA